MHPHHNLAHAALAIVYVVTAAILIREHAVPHACCALAAATIYAALWFSASSAWAAATRLFARGRASLCRVWQRVVTAR
jgi:hypothetical protein